jgi:hypothetical protein
MQTGQFKTISGCKITEARKIKMGTISEIIIKHILYYSYRDVLVTEHVQ